MNKRRARLFFGTLFAAGVVWGVCCAPCAFAGDATGGWRPVYDLVMRWVNFLILAFVIVKFGRAPLMNFLKGEGRRIEEEIRELELEKEQALTKVAETEKMLEESAERFRELTERIVRQGERKKQEIIEDARSDSRQMIEDAKRKAGSLLLRAREQFRTELVDTAVALATERLTAGITVEDNRKLVEAYMASIEK